MTITMLRVLRPFLKTLPDTVSGQSSLGYPTVWYKCPCAVQRRWRWPRMRYDYGRNIMYTDERGGAYWTWEWNSLLENEWLLDLPRHVH